jgi:threonine synthase
MDWGLVANRNGHIACPHGGESLAGLVAARKQGIVDTKDTAVLDSTAHALKFAGFQQLYFEKRFPPEFKVNSQPALVNTPIYVHPKDLEKVPAAGKPLEGKDLQQFVNRISEEIAMILNLEKV